MGRVYEFRAHYSTPLFQENKSVQQSKQSTQSAKPDTKAVINSDTSNRSVITSDTSNRSVISSDTSNRCSDRNSSNNRTQPIVGTEPLVSKGVPDKNAKYNSSKAQMAAVSR